MFYLISEISTCQEVGVCLKVVNVMEEPHQGFKVVAWRTGLSAHVIRIWEKRYGAVQPECTTTNRRLYSDKQIERLRLLRDITQAGHSIGHVAKLPVETLRQLASESDGAPCDAPRSRTRPPAVPAAETFIEECIAAVKSLNAPGLEEALKRAAVELGAQGLLQRVVAQFYSALDDLCKPAKKVKR